MRRSISRLRDIVVNPAFAVLLFLSIDANFYFHGERSDRLLHFDAKGYYSYLPAVFIYRDLNFGFFESIEQTYYRDQFEYDYRRTVNGQYINKYFVGTALLQLPFFEIAHLLAVATDSPADGYSNYYRLAVLAAAIFYCVLGVWLVDKTLARHFNIRLGVRWVALLSIVFGTNLHYYAVVEPGFSHAYSFFAVAAWMYAACAFLKVPDKRWLWIAALSLGLILIIRPVNGLVVFALPFLAGTRSVITNALIWMSSRWKLLALSIVAIAVPVFLQLLIYKLQCGSWLVDAYGEEGFNFDKPAILEFLFSYRKGAFLYTPLLLFIIVIGALTFQTGDAFRFISFLTFFTIVVYVLSSWYMWYYGGSFSARPLVEYYPFFALLLALGLKRMRRKTFGTAVVAMFLLVVFCQLQMWQYRDRMIHWDKMTRDQYWDVFLKLPAV